MHKKLDIMTLKSLFKIYCSKHHDSPKGELCPSCRSELDYAVHKTEICKYKDKGKTCSSCKVHCFEGEHRENIRQIMRFAGPRLIWIRPLLAIRYVYLKLKSSGIKQ